jgi:hypothetical protein
MATPAIHLKALLTDRAGTTWSVITRPSATASASVVSQNSATGARAGAATPAAR